MTWHLDPAQVRGYADGTTGGARAASVEAHVLACADCRGLLAAAAPTDRLTAVWDSVQETVDSPRRSWIEQLLIRARVPEDDARLLAATPALQASWLLALVGVLAFATAAAGADDRWLRIFLVVAPLVPVLGVAGAYGRGIDPTYELTRATPYPTVRLLLLRVVAVLTVSVIVTAAFSSVATQGWDALAWLLPSLAMVGLVLVLSRVVDLPLAAGAVALVYVIAVFGLLLRRRDVVDLFARSGQLVSLCVAAACLAVVLSPARRAAFRRVP